MENFEITVKVNTSKEKLNDYLLNNGFKIVDKYDCYDRYMINKDLDISNMNELDIIKNCILVRDLPNIKKCLTFKKKEYDSKGNIIHQEKVDCIVEDIDKALKFMELINYRVLFEIYDKLTVYSNGKIEISSQFVNDKYLYIEMEDTSLHTPSHNYNNLDDMIKDFDSIGIDYDKSDYFVSKAKIILKEVR